MKNIAIGIDIGGTFTDIVAIDYATGESQSRKVLTTHETPSDGAINGLQLLLAESAIEPGDVVRLVHATTLFTNALIENKGAPTGLLATSGFGDVIEIGRERRYDLYDIGIDEARPLVPHRLRREIGGRLDASGKELEPLSRPEVEESVAALVQEGAQSIAVCLLHAYADAKHERQVEQWIQEVFPDLSVSLSCDVAPEIREFDRLCTTAANASIKPIASYFVDDLVGRI
jgi:N-methylhydantoinase A